MRVEWLSPEDRSLAADLSRTVQKFSFSLKKTADPEIGGGWGVMLSRLRDENHKQICRGG